MTEPIDLIPDKWRSRLDGVARGEAFADTLRKVADDRRLFEVYPADNQIFAALELTPPESIRVVILGQDPYPGEGMAHGLAFSVASTNARIPRSLQNIIRSTRPDLSYARPANGSLEPWARQGVLLLNTILTVRRDHAGSHKDFGWQALTESVIVAANQSTEPVIFLLWGKQARASAKLVDRTRHEVIETSHPSPLSARHGFLEDRPLTTANAILRSAGKPEIDWTVGV